MRRAGVFAALLLAAQPAWAQPDESPGPKLPHPAPKAATGSVPVVDEERGPPCEAAFIERVYKATRPSIVRITRPDGALGTGFVYHSNRHVATALHVVDLGRELRVEFPDGKTTSAKVVAVDEDHDLAMLELADPTDAPVLLPRFGVSIGSPIVAIGNPYGDLARFAKELTGLLNFSISQGIVSAKSEAYIQTDAVLSPGNSGGPMLTCDGKVVGVADRLLDQRIGFGVPVIHVAALALKVGQQGVYRGRWAPGDAVVGFTYQNDANTYLGFYLGQSLVGYDRIPVTIRLGMSFAGKGDTTAPITERPLYRFWTEATAGYRFLFFPYAFPSYLTLGGGMFATVTRGSETRLGISPTNAGQLVSTRKTIKGGGIQPLVTVAAQVSNLELSYGFALDVLHPNASTHRVLLGLAF